jgi:hypothetical protein
MQRARETRKPREIRGWERSPRVKRQEVSCHTWCQMEMTLDTRNLESVSPEGSNDISGVPLPMASKSDFDLVVSDGRCIA